MENVGSTCSNNNRGQNGNYPNNNLALYNSTMFQDASLSHAFGYDPQHHHQNNSHYSYHQQPSCYGGAPPHVMCLKLGKRHYFEDTSVASGGAMELPAVNGSLTVVTAATCSVDGCDVSLENAKEYHRRHKVCEMHSKAPRVVVHGLEQRFCQQCSRFQGISEFDDAKRSCRRRLADHNERRRKICHDSTVKNPYDALAPECAHSLLSLKSDHRPWVCPSDFSSRSSAALRELIAENRASFVARQQMYHDLSHKTLDLMQAKKEREEECYEVWNNSLEGTLMM